MLKEIHVYSHKKKKKSNKKLSEIPGTWKKEMAPGVSRWRKLRSNLLSLLRKPQRPGAAVIRFFLELELRWGYEAGVRERFPTKRPAFQLPFPPWRFPVDRIIPVASGWGVQGKVGSVVKLQILKCRYWMCAKQQLLSKIQRTTLWGLQDGLYVYSSPPLSTGYMFKTLKECLKPQVVLNPAYSRLSISAVSCSSVLSLGSPCCRGRRWQMYMR